jgi:hypothetical protein
MHDVADVSGEVPTHGQTRHLQLSMNHNPISCVYGLGPEPFTVFTDHVSLRTAIKSPNASRNICGVQTTLTSCYKLN